MDFKLNARGKTGITLLWTEEHGKYYAQTFIRYSQGRNCFNGKTLNKQELKSMRTLHKSLSPLYFALFANGPVHFKVTEGNSLMVPKLLVMTHAFVNGNIYLNPNDLANHMIDWLILNMWIVKTFKKNKYCFKCSKKNVWRSLYLAPSMY